MALLLGAAGILGGGQPAEPGGPPAAHALPTMPVHPKTYSREMFSDASNSLTRDCLAHYLQGYCFTDGCAGPVPAPAALRDQTVVLSDRQPMAFLCLTHQKVGFCITDNIC